MTANSTGAESPQKYASKADGEEDDKSIVEHVAEKDQEQEKDLSTDFDTTEHTGAHDDKDVEAQQEEQPQYRTTLASEDYSAFTVPQKRAIIVAGSFLAWFSPVSEARC